MLRWEDQEKIRQQLSDAPAPAAAAAPPAASAASAAPAPKKRGTKRSADEDSEDAAPQKKGKRGKQAAAQAPPPPPPAKLAGFEKKLADQTKALWELIDSLKTNCSLSQMRELLEYNGLPTHGGEARLVQRLADHMFFGMPPQCPENCDKSGRLVSLHVYYCSISSHFLYPRNLLVLSTFVQVT